MGTSEQACLSASCTSVTASAAGGASGAAAGATGGAAGLGITGGCRVMFKLACRVACRPGPAASGTLAAAGVMEGCWTSAIGAGVGAVPAGGVGVGSAAACGAGGACEGRGTVSERRDPAGSGAGGGRGASSGAGGRAGKHRQHRDLHRGCLLLNHLSCWWLLGGSWGLRCSGCPRRHGPPLSLCKCCKGCCCRRLTRCDDWRRSSAQH